MPDNEKLNAILERFYNRYNAYNTLVLRKLGETVKLFDGIDVGEARILAQQLKYGVDVDILINELAKISGKSIQDVEVLLNNVAKENVDFAEIYYKAKNKEFLGYENNKQLQKFVDTIIRTTNETFLKLQNSKNIGFTFKDSQGNTIFKPLKDVYNELIDKAVNNISIGETDYQSAMRNIINSLADSGIKIHEEKVAYSSGYNRRIDSSVRQSVLDGIRTTNIGIQELVGKEFGADGVEVSAHSPCADDHLSINGRQFSKKDFKKINGNLKRPVGTLNCRHFVFSIVLGVNKPEYTNKQLKQMEQYSHSKIEYEGKQYTKYEATQVQRQLETEIRRQKDRQIIARASGDKEEIAKAQAKIQQLTQKYNDFSRVARLETYKSRLTVTGYKRVSTK